MKKRTLMLLPVLLLVSCNIGNSISVKYDDADKYTVGDLETTDAVSTINLNYITGKIHFSYVNDSKVYVSEKANKEIPEDVQMRYYLKDGVLNIQPCATGRRDYTNASRQLEIKIPTSYSLEKIKIDSVSSDIKLDVNADKYVINTVSGDLSMEIDSFSSITCNVVSADAEIKIKNSLGVSVEFNTVSGELTNDFKDSNDSQKIKFDSVSGDLHIKK